MTRCRHWRAAADRRSLLTPTLVAPYRARTQSRLPSALVMQPAVTFGVDAETPLRLLKHAVGLAPVATCFAAGGFGLAFLDGL
jgi:hypothetical protein